MKQTLKISFEETQKSVNALVTFEVERDLTRPYTDEDVKLWNDTSLIEAKRLFEEAQKYSKVKTLQKNI